MSDEIAEALGRDSGCLFGEDLVGSSLTEIVGRKMRGGADRDVGAMRIVDNIA